MVISFTDEQRNAIGSIQYMQNLAICCIRDEISYRANQVHAQTRSVQISRQSRKEHALHPVPARMIYSRKLYLGFSSQEDAEMASSFISSEYCYSTLLMRVIETFERNNTKELALLNNKSVQDLLIPQISLNGGNLITVFYDNLMLPEYVIKVMKEKNNKKPTSFYVRKIRLPSQ